MQMSPGVQTRCSPIRRRLPLAMFAAIVGSAVGVRGSLAEPDPVEGPHRAEMLAAHAVARVALLDLKIVANPSQRDYRIAEEMLATAATLLPNDQTILRLYMEAAAGADDAQTVRDISRRLVKLDPDDTVSLLRVVSAKISDLQTADQRLAAYDQFVSGEGAEAFDASVRSRLALDGALLARERGDLRGFVERLWTAIKLDPTNRDAATLVLAFYSSNPDPNEPAGRLDLMFQVLWTDPFDPAIYSSVVSELLSKGAFKGALRFAKMQRFIYGVQARPIPESDQNAYDLSEWSLLGPDAVIRRLSDALQKDRERAVERRKEAQAQAIAIDAFPTPEDVRLPASRERSRIVCAAAMLDRERASIFLSELATTVATLSRDAADPIRRPASLTQEQAIAQAADARLELCWLRILTGLQLDEAAKTLSDVRTSNEMNPAVIARFDAWMELRTGDKVKAEETLGALAAADPLAAIGHALAAEMRGDPNTAIVRNAAIAHKHVGDYVGAFAATRYTALTGERLPTTDVAKTLEADAAGVPAWLDAMVENPRRAMSLEVTALRKDVNPLQRTPIRVTLRNTSQIALPMGPDKPLCTRLLFAPQIDMGSEIMPTADLVWVANMDRRLRLLPNESVDMLVWPDLGPLSFEMEWWLPKQARVRWRVLQGFELSPQRLYDAAPQMLTADVVPLVRRLPPRADGVFAALQSALQTGGPTEIADVLLSLKLQMVEASKKQRELPASDIDKLFEVLAQQFASLRLQRASKILTLCLAPTQRLPLPQALRLDQAVAPEVDEEVLAVALVTRTTGPTDPLLTLPAVLRSTRLTALAQLVKDRLEAGTPTFSTSPVDVRELVDTAPRKPAPVEPIAGSSPSAANPGAPAPGDQRPARVIVPTVPPDPNPVPIVH